MRGDPNVNQMERDAFDELIRAFINNVRILVRNTRPAWSPHVIVPLASGILGFECALHSFRSIEYSLRMCVTRLYVGKMHVLLVLPERRGSGRSLVPNHRRASWNPDHQQTMRRRILIFYSHSRTRRTSLATRAIWTKQILDSPDRISPL